MRIITTSIKNIKLKSFIREVLWCILIASVIGTSFVVGMIYERQRLQNLQVVSIRTNHDIISKWNSYIIESHQGTFVASKNGTKFYPITCSASKRINEENKVYFVSKEEAQSFGYEASASCS